MTWETSEDIKAERAEYQAKYEAMVDSANQLRRHVADLERVLARHVKWRDKALRYLCMVRDRVAGYRHLIENFIDDSTTTMIESNPGSPRLRSLSDPVSGIDSASGSLYGGKISQIDYLAGTVEILAAEIERLKEALGLVAVGTICPDLFPNEANKDALAAKTAMTIAAAALEVSASQSTSAEEQK